MNAVVWYLVFSFWSNGGVATIPQASKEACLDNVKWILNRGYGNSKTACIPGVALQVSNR